MQTSDVIASLALLISVFSIWLQVRSDRNQLMIGNFLEYTKRYQEIITHFPKEVVLDDFNFESFSNSEQENILRYMWLYFDLCYEEYCLHDLGYINSDLWELWKSGMKSAFSKPAFKKCWQIIIKNTNYKSDFIRFVQTIM